MTLHPSDDPTARDALDNVTELHPFRVRRANAADTRTYESVSPSLLTLAGRRHVLPLSVHSACLWQALHTGYKASSSTPSKTSTV